MPASTRKPPTCDDCYFRRKSLCALEVERPCPTFRAATSTLQPPQHPPLMPRQLPAVEPAGAAA